MAAIDHSDAEDPQFAWDDKVRQLLKQHMTIIHTVQQLAQYRQQLVTTDQLERLGTQQGEVAQELRQLLDEHQSSLEPAVRETLSSLAQRQADLADAARAMTSAREAVEELSGKQSQAIQRSEDLARELRRVLIDFDVYRLDQAVREVLAHSQLDEEALSQLFDLSRPD